MDLVGAAGDATVILVMPLPRYVIGKCCADEGHITNFETEDFEIEIQRAEDNAIAAAGLALASSNVHTYAFKDTFGHDMDLTDMVTTAGASLWRLDDPVHLSPEAYGEIAAAIAGLGRQTEPPVQRDRLDSVVPGNSVKHTNKPKAKPSPWVLGQSNRGSDSGWQRGARGGRGIRGWGGRARPWNGGRGRHFLCDSTC